MIGLAIDYIGVGLVVTQPSGVEAAFVADVRPNNLNGALQSSEPLPKKSIDVVGPGVGNGVDRFQLFHYAGSKDSKRFPSGSTSLSTPSPQVVANKNGERTAPANEPGFPLAKAESEDVHPASWLWLLVMLYAAMPLPSRR